MSWQGLGEKTRICMTTWVLSWTKKNCRGSPSRRTCKRASKCASCHHGGIEERMVGWLVEWMNLLRNENTVCQSCPWWQDDNRSIERKQNPKVFAAAGGLVAFLEIKDSEANDWLWSNVWHIENNNNMIILWYCSQWPEDPSFINGEYDVK